MNQQTKIMYYNYHAKVKNLIVNGHCLGYEKLEKYKDISPCLLIYFDNHSPMPIRQHRFDEYMFLFAKYDIKEKQSD